MPFQYNTHGKSSVSIIRAIRLFRITAKIYIYRKTVSSEIPNSSLYHHEAGTELT